MTVGGRFVCPFSIGRSKMVRMRRLIVWRLSVCGFLLVVLFGNVRAQEINDDIFNRHFVDKTMRVDYFHAGGLGAEILGLDQIVSDGVWAGSRSRLVDNLNLGKYLFEVIDRETNGVIYSRGFASIYGEWETIPVLFNNKKKA